MPLRRLWPLQDQAPGGWRHDGSPGCPGRVGQGEQLHLVVPGHGRRPRHDRGMTGYALITTTNPTRCAGWKLEASNPENPYRTGLLAGGISVVVKVIGRLTRPAKTPKRRHNFWL